VELGFGVATSTYHKNGYAVEQAEADLNRLVDDIKSREPDVDAVYITGASEGGPDRNGAVRVVDPEVLEAIHELDRSLPMCRSCCYPITTTSKRSRRGFVRECAVTSPPSSSWRSWQPPSTGWKPVMEVERTLSEGLTPREMEVAARLRQGKPNKVIAHELEISESTVKAFVRRILIKLHALNRTEVAT
jgi:DNA-binding CsgD family transcriptional regulator